MEASVTRAPKDELTFLGGNRYIFSYKHNRIEFWTSSFTGKEVVKLNGKVVSEDRSFRMVNQHYFDLRGKPMMVEIKLSSLLRGPVYCALHECGNADTWQPVAAKKLVVWPPKNDVQGVNEKPVKSLRARILGWLQLVFFFALGMLLSRSTGSFSWQFWVITLAFVGVFILWKHLYKRRTDSKGQKVDQLLGMYIVDISIEQLDAETSSNTAAAAKP